MSHSHLCALSNKPRDLTPVSCRIQTPSHFLNMSHIFPSTHTLNLSNGIGEGVPGCASKCQRYAPFYVYRPKRPYTTANSRDVTSFNILDDDSLINIFVYRPDLLDEDESNDTRILQGGEWRRECWWYKLVHVCRRWRSLILESPSHLGLSPLYTSNAGGLHASTFVPLPLVIDHANKTMNLTPEAGSRREYQVCPPTPRSRASHPPRDVRPMSVEVDQPHRQGIPVPGTPVPLSNVLRR